MYLRQITVNMGRFEGSSSPSVRPMLYNWTVRLDLSTHFLILGTVLEKVIAAMKMVSGINQQDNLLTRPKYLDLTHSCSKAWHPPNNRCILNISTRETDITVIALCVAVS